MIRNKGSISTLISTRVLAGKTSAGFYLNSKGTLCVFFRSSPRNHRPLAAFFMINDDPAKQTRDIIAHISAEAQTNTGQDEWSKTLFIGRSNTTAAELSFSREAVSFFDMPGPQKRRDGRILARRH